MPPVQLIRSLRREFPRQFPPAWKQLARFLTLNLTNPLRDIRIELKVSIKITFTLDTTFIQLNAVGLNLSFGCAVLIYLISNSSVECKNAFFAIVGDISNFFHGFPFVFAENLEKGAYLCPFRRSNR